MKKKKKKTTTKKKVKKTKNEKKSNKRSGAGRESQEGDKGLVGPRIGSVERATCCVRWNGKQHGSTRFYRLDHSTRATWELSTRQN